MSASTCLETLGESFTGCKEYTAGVFTASHAQATVQLHVQLAPKLGFQPAIPLDLRLSVQPVAQMAAVKVAAAVAAVQHVPVPELI